MAVSCDVILASNQATFGYPEIDLGLLPAIHYAHLPRLVGRHSAFELLFSGRSFSAEEAHNLKIVNKVLNTSEALDGAVRELAETFKAKSETAVRRGRAAMMRQLDHDYRRSIATAVEDFCNVAVGRDAQERLRAFASRKRIDKA